MDGRIFSNIEALIHTHEFYYVIADEKGYRASSFLNGICTAPANSREIALNAIEDHQKKLKVNNPIMIYRYGKDPERDKPEFVFWPSGEVLHLTDGYYLSKTTNVPIEMSIKRYFWSNDRPESPLMWNPGSSYDLDANMKALIKSSGAYIISLKEGLLVRIDEKKADECYKYTTDVIGLKEAIEFIRDDSFRNPNCNYPTIILDGKTDEPRYVYFEPVIDTLTGQLKEGDELMTVTKGFYANTWNETQEKSLEILAQIEIMDNLHALI